MARRLHNRSVATTTEALWRDACGGDLARRLRKPYHASSSEALRRVV